MAKHIVKLGFWVAVLGGLVLIGHELELYLPAIESHLHDLGPWAPFGYTVVFITLTPFFVSVDALCIAAGILFPLGAGVLYMMLSTYLSAALIFVLGRRLCKRKVSAYIAKHERFAVLHEALGQKSFKLMLLLRMTPLPFALLSYTFAVARVGFPAYLAATSGIFIYNITLVYLGYTGKHLSAFVGGVPHQLPVPLPLLAAGLGLALVLLLYLSRLATKTLHAMKIEQDKSVGLR